MKEKIKEIGKHVIYVLSMLIVSYVVMSFMLWDMNVSSWETGERVGMMLVAVVMMISERIIHAIDNMDEEDYNDEFLDDDDDGYLS